MSTVFRLGLIINPLAGLGGRAALKGSDGVAEQALAMGVEPLAQQRVRVARSVTHTRCPRAYGFYITGGYGLQA